LSERDDRCAIRFLVFHGGSGSSKEEINIAVGHGVVKMNVDTDTQYAYMTGMRASISVHAILSRASGSKSSPEHRISLNPRNNISKHKSVTLRDLTNPTRR
jgi:fructose/tagatose bisphosphate aldolase